MDKLFKEIKISESLPKKEGDYFVKFKGRSDFQSYYFLDALHDQDYLEKNVESYLEEFFLIQHDEEKEELVKALKECWQIIPLDTSVGKVLFVKIHKLIKKHKEIR